MKQDMIAVLDLGSTKNTELARAIRALGVYSEIYPHDITAEDLEKSGNLKGIILFGGENRVVDGSPVEIRQELYDMGCPMMSIDHPTSKCPQKLEAMPEEEGLKKFVFGDCKAEANWNMKNFIEDQVELVRRKVGDKKVLLALSGGVDSSVVAALFPLRQKINAFQFARLFFEYTDEFRADNLSLLFRICHSGQFSEKTFLGVHINQVGVHLIFKYFDYAFRFALPHQPMVHMYANQLPANGFDQQGLVEPLYYLFKDEVRACGLELGLPREMVYRQPFPGPGLGVRCLGAITKERLEAVRESDAILREEFAIAGLDRKVWQYFTAVPDFKSVGVRNHARCFEYPVIIRAVNTVDAMSATVEQVDWQVLLKITDRIMKEVPNVNRVCYDLSPKPTATIEWE